MPCPAKGACLFCSVLPDVAGTVAGEEVNDSAAVIASQSCQPGPSRKDQVINPLM